MPYRSLIVPRFFSYSGPHFHANCILIKANRGAPLQTINNTMHPMSAKQAKDMDMCLDDVATTAPVVSVQPNHIFIGSNQLKWSNGVKRGQTLEGLADILWPATAEQPVEIYLHPSGSG